MQYDIDMQGEFAEVFTKVRIRELIEESFVLGMEAYELKKLRCNLKSK
ncbi:MAG: Unknown protein [uncultured Sulfurovum sp.]|uniref:Uncharacterized protein n=1 Tax=uncultured Sulfurovum sp. TaxID=269237 RepID=A0A6S6TAL7_9BACT|nr:MAG: Unknown protein [uncultured Sulfurovum sp.]